MIGTAGVPNWSIIHKFAEIFFRADWITERPGRYPHRPPEIKDRARIRAFQDQISKSSKAQPTKIKIKKVIARQNYFPKMHNTSHYLVQYGTSKTYDGCGTRTRLYSNGFGSETQPWMFMQHFVK